MRRYLLSVMLLAPGLCAAAEDFPRPASLEPAVGFWTRVFDEAPSRGGFLHDPEHLDVVYERLDLPEDRRAAQRKIDARKAHYAAALRALASHPKAPANATEKHLRGLWPKAGPATLRAAAGRVRFQRGQADKFHAGLHRSGRWERFIRDTFAARGLPLELTALPHVESSFNPNAGSHVGARGLWQFMPETGRLFMRVDHLVDERLDPYRATESAAALLKQNHEYVGTWPLAITAYNHGRGGVQRAKRTLGTDDIGRIIAEYRGPYFGFASRNFYPSFLAALDLSTAAAGTAREPAEALVSVALPAYVHPHTLGSSLGVPLATLQAHNPAVKEEIWSGRKYLPKGYVLHLPAEIAGAEGAARVMQVAQVSGHAAQRPDLTHRVTRGDTLGAIARRYGTTTRELMAANGIQDPRRLRAGATLRLPGKVAPEPEVRLASAGAKAAKPKPEPRVIRPSGAVLAASVIPTFGTSPDESDATLARADEPDLALTADGRMQVRPGESVALIADWAGVSAAALRRHAGLNAADGLQVGQGLRVPLNRTDAKTIEARRRAHHTAVRKAFLERHTIEGAHTHRVRAGESLWGLSEKTYRVPLWLVLAYNRDLELAALRPGTTLRFPRLKPRA